MSRGPGELRIIGGEWRSRRLRFADEGGAVRPTPDRVRQTLFDWLAPVVDGCRCLDLFAGSGALGLEALSRGAAEAWFVDAGQTQVSAIQAAIQALGAGARARAERADALVWLDAAPPERRYELVFLDPPYDAGLLPPVLARLAPRLAVRHFVYLEWRRGAEPALPEGWHWWRQKEVAGSGFGLAQCQSPPQQQLPQPGGVS